MCCYRWATSILYYGGTLLTTSVFQYDEHCGEYISSVRVCVRGEWWATVDPLIHWDYIVTQNVAGCDPFQFILRLYNSSPLIIPSYFKLHYESSNVCIIY